MPDSARRTVATAARKILALALAAGDAEEIKAASIVCERALSTCEVEYTESSADEKPTTEVKKDLLM
jgi:hypothetical protein